jgi:hypothetical protein
MTSHTNALCCVLGKWPLRPSAACQRSMIKLRYHRYGTTNLRFCVDLLAAAQRKTAQAPGLRTTVVARDGC